MVQSNQYGDDEPTKEFPALVPRTVTERLEHRIAFASRQGRGHIVNQDCGGAWTRTRPDGMPASLVIVADGVSAGRQSEEASRLAVDVVARQIVPHLNDDRVQLPRIAQILREAVSNANDAISERPYRSLREADTTTLVALVVVGALGIGIWVGDSRAYAIRGGNAEQLTRDHSWAEAVVRDGLMTAEDASRDFRSRMITRWLGPPRREELGLESFEFQLNSGDVALCCTDGLYQYFSPPEGKEEEMARLFGENGDDLNAGIDAAMDVALRRGSRDDISVAALRVI